MASICALLAFVDFNCADDDTAGKAVEIQAELGLHFLFVFCGVASGAGVDVNDASNIRRVISVLDFLVAKHDQLGPRLANTQSSERFVGGL